MNGVVQVLSWAHFFTQVDRLKAEGLYDLKEHLVRDRFNQLNLPLDLVGGRGAGR